MSNSKHITRLFKADPTLNEAETEEWCPDFSDSTHLKASANKNRYDAISVTLQAYPAELKHRPRRRPRRHGKTPLPDTPHDAPPTREVKLSRTDPKAGYRVCDGKPTGFFYLDHRTGDGADALISDIHVTPASVLDSVPYLARLDRMRQRFHFGVGAVGWMPTTSPGHLQGAQ